MFINHKLDHYVYHYWENELNSYCASTDKKRYIGNYVSAPWLTEVIGRSGVIPRAEIVSCVSFADAQCFS